MQLKFEKKQLNVIKNNRATYSIAELKDYTDFEIKRIYFIQNCKENTGQHCHLAEREVFVMASGECTAIIDRGSGKEDVKLRGPGDAVYVGNYVWHGFKDFSSDAILLALSSTNFNPDRSDYIEDYEQYLEKVKSL
jgi:mannose-6-phosphate isomerase-like protein (cupin superfamily)